MLVWVRTIPPGRFQLKEKRSRNWGPRNLHKECAHPNRWRDKHTHTHTPIYKKKHTLSYHCHSDFFVIPTNFQRPENVLSSKFSSMVVLEPVFWIVQNQITSPTSPNQSTHFCLLQLGFLMRQPNYVGFSKTGSDTTIEPNFDEKDSLWHLKVGGYNQKKISVTKKWRSVNFFVL